MVTIMQDRSRFVYGENLVFGTVANDLVLRIGGMREPGLRFLLLLLNRQVGMY